jgi:hypothetical protein
VPKQQLRGYKLSKETRESTTGISANNRGSHMSKCTGMHNSHIQIAGASIDRKQLRYHQLNMTKKVVLAKEFQKGSKSFEFS